MTLKFTDYIEQKILGIGPRGKCPNSDSSSREFCIFEAPRNNQEAKYLAPYQEGKVGGQSTQTRGNLWWYSRGICIGLEAWWAGLKQQPDQGKTYYGESCKPKKAQARAMGTATGSDCEIPSQNLQWAQWHKRREISTWNPSARYLGVCMDIVSMILENFQMYTPKRPKEATGLNTDPCQALYESLEKWGGGRKGCAYNGRLGKDLYEVVTELFYGDDQGEKNVYCKLLPRGDQASQDSGGKYKLEVQKGYEFKTCSAGADACEQLEEYKNSVAESLHEGGVPDSLISSATSTSSYAGSFSRADAGNGQRNSGVSANEDDMSEH
ncbi:hypothetical protein C922_05631 [Plasmodium inui San Antonio 1]|uniref:Uncharacterized protein n=1 Tax=Plasmodium inui San Antonio 1 TaxID=1237626 RepID=W7A4F8_9APIC|nr:hypothetical protein C922_05631 [Plasmodium inui San Antonio 1]EUD63989.1 hypothetical protein C922_05631 [Plasmodium inui San Antonio 1]